MKRSRILLAIMLLMGSLTGIAQQVEAKPWKLTLQNKELNLRLQLDLYEETVNVPGMDMFGPMNGYIAGSLCNVWSLTSFKINNDDKVTLRLSNDLGSETQECTLTHENDSTYRLDIKGTVHLRKVENRKYVKMPPVIYFQPRK